jgi:chromosome segregation ATPase
MESLKETLAALTQSLPDLPEHLRGLLADVDALEASGQTLRDEAGEARNEADQQLEPLIQSLVELREEAAAQVQGLDRELGELEAAVAELEELEAAQQGVGEAVDAVGTSMDQLKGEVGEGAAAIEAARQGFTIVLDRIEERTRSAAQELQAAASAAEAAGDAAQGAIDAARSEVASQVAAMAAASAAAQVALQSVLQEAVGSLPGLASELRSSLDTMRGDLQAALDDLKDQWRQRLEDELAPGIDTAVEGVKTALATLDEHAADSAGKWSDGREAAETPLEAVQEQLPSLDTGVASVKEAADQVGLAWT